MKKIIALLLILVVFGLSGCAKSTEQTSVTNSPAVVASSTPTANTGSSGSGTVSANTVTAAEISNDIESISNDVAALDVNSTGDAIVPITADELSTD